MNCTGFRAAIAAAIEKREAAPAEAAAHLDHCHDPRCRADWNEAALLQRAIENWRNSFPQIDLADAVVAAWRAGDCVAVRSITASVSTDRRRVREPRTGAPRAMVAIAAAAVLLVALVLLAPGPDQLVAKRENPPRDPVGNAGLACVNYAQNAAQIVTDAVVLTLGGAEQMEDPKVEPIGIGWDADWPPLSEVHAALDDLMESLPADPPPS